MMILDLLKTPTGLATAAATGLIIIGGATYVLAPVSAPSPTSPTEQIATAPAATEGATPTAQAAAPATSTTPADSDVIPARFSIEVTPADKRLLCDLTVNQQQMCEQRFGKGFNDIVVISRHAGDPTRAVIIAQNTRKEGVTWAQLQHGIDFGWVQVKALPPS